MLTVWISTFWWGQGTQRARAQPHVEWSTPIKLSEQTPLNRHPTIVADLWGGAHAFWDQVVGGANTNNAIYYAYWDGHHWSEPHDLFIGPGWASFNHPYALCDGEGVIHLVWSSYDRLYYSSAPALEADDAQAWQPTQVPVQAYRLEHSRLIADARGVLHIIYNLRSPGTNVSYLRSENGGLSWSVPMEISNNGPSDPQVPTEVRMAADGDGGLHVVWTESYPPEFLGRHVFYARSIDGGMTWMRPKDLSGPVTEKNVNHHINLAVDNGDRIHVVWAGGPAGSNRLYRYSTDRGESWSTGQQIYGDMVGWGGWDAMASDPYGNVYWAGLLRYPRGFYASSLTNGEWYDPPQILLDESSYGLLAQGHFPQLTVGMGNQIHLVFVEGDIGAIWHMYGQTVYPSLPTPTALVLTTVPHPTETESTPTRSPMTESGKRLYTDPGPTADPSLMPVIAGAVPALFVVLIAVLFHRVRLQR